MRDREDDNPFRKSPEYDVIREIVDGQLPDIGIIDSKDRPTGVRETLDQCDRAKDFAQKS